MSSSEFQANGKLAQLVSKYRPHIDQFAKVYKSIRQHPELSQREFRTAKLAGKHLSKEGYEVFEGIGGHSAVGVLHNGPEDSAAARRLDALPLKCP
jgi:hippurate hydrolase